MRPYVLDVLRSYGVGFLGFLVPPPEVAYGIVVAVVLMVYFNRSRETRLPSKLATGSAVAAAAAGLIGTRLFYLVVSRRVVDSASIEWLSLSGTASWGAYVGAAAGMVVFLGLRRASPWPYLDAAATVLPLGIAIGRIGGCFMNGDDFGTRTVLPWAIRYPAGSYAYEAHSARGLLSPDATASLATHPVQLYLAANAVLLFILISTYWRRHRSTPGLTFGVFWLLYAPTRFVLEFFRDPAGGGADSGLSTGQWMCLVLLSAGLMIAVLRYPSIADERPS